MSERSGEFGLIRRHFARRVAPNDKVLLGIGDDCALLRAPLQGQVLAVSSDMLVEGHHFLADADPASIGHKSLAVNLSDLAAMGAEPLGFTLAIALPRIDDAWLDAYCDGLFALAQRADCPLVGGDTTRGPLCVSITVFGQVPPDEALRRSGARPGDDLWISGPLGGAAFAVAARAAQRSVPADAARRLDWPEPRLELGRALRGLASAAIDVSDGLAGDLSHLLEASACAGARIELARLPIAPALDTLPRVERASDIDNGPVPERLRFALDGGDDYELLFTARPAARTAIDALAQGSSRIGSVSAEVGILLSTPDGSKHRWRPASFDHFR